MANTIDPSSAFVTLVVFFGLLTGGTVFMGDVFTKHNVDQSDSLQVNKQYEDLKNNSQSVQTKLKTLTSTDGSFVDTASAGITIVPKTLNLLSKPLEIALSTIGAVQTTYQTLIPGWFATMLQLLLTLSIMFGIFRVLLGLNRV